MAEARQLITPVDTQEGVVAVAPFEQWKYEDALKAMRDLLPSDFDTRRAYAVEKDHFQNGSQWVGPGDPKGNEKIEQQFAPDDAIGEVLSNIENAFSEPQVGGAPLEETDTGATDVIARAVRILSDWWDRRNLHEMILDRIRTSAWAGHADLRIWIPWRHLIQTPNGVQVRPAASIEEALDYIHVMAPNPRHCAIITDSSTQDRIAVFLDEEVVYNGNERTSYPRAELIYLDPNRVTDEDADTIMRVVYANDAKPSMRATFQTNGKLLFSEMRTRPVVTDPVMRTQRQLNLLSSLITRLGETAAFRERYIKNAKPQGIRIPYNDGDSLANGAFVERDDEGRQWQVIPQTRTLGASTTTELIGLPAYDDKGDAKGYVMPDVTIVDPVDPGPYIRAAEDTRKKIMRMCGQGHLASGSNIEASGIAYEQARAVFEKDLKRRRVAEEGMLRDLLTTVLVLAEQISGNTGEITGRIRITVDQHVFPGPRSPDLVRLDLESYEAGVLSLETTMSRVGVEDVDAEMVRVEKAAKHIMTLLEKAVQVSKVFDTESVIEVLRELGLPDNVLDQLEVPEPVAPPVEPAGFDGGDGEAEEEAPPIE